MNILHLTPWQQPCGIAGYAGDLVGALQNAGTCNHVHALNQRGRRYPLAQEVRAEMDRVCRRAKDYDLVHIQHEFSFFSDFSQRVDAGIGHFGYLLANLSRMKKPVAVTFHTEPNFQRPWRFLTRGPKGIANFGRSYLSQRRWHRTIRPYFRRGSRCAAIVHTDKARATLVDVGFDPTRIHKMLIGVTPRHGKVDSIGRTHAREELGYPAGAVVLSMFGFIAEYKGYHLATAALLHLQPHFHLAIIGGPHPQSSGDTTLNAILKMMAEYPELANRVRVTGYADSRTIDLYHAATDICLAPYCNFNHSASAGINWALTSGRPVVASKIPSFMELQDEAECLMLCTENAEHELAWQINRLMGDPRLQQELVRNATAYAERHSWPRVASEVLAVYGSLVGKAFDVPVPSLLPFSPGRAA